MIVKKLFEFRTGKLEALEHTDSGNVPLVYGTAENNGVVKFVFVEDESYIFNPPLITVSYLGTAFVQTVPFTTSVVDKSNIIVLEPKKEMSLEELYFYCYQINKQGEYGFSYGRRMNMARLEKLNLVSFSQKYQNQIEKINIEKLKPIIKCPNSININTRVFVPIETYFEIINAKSHSFDVYDYGDYAFVSNGFINKGIIGYVYPYDDDRVFVEPCISISAFCEAIVQNQPFIARGNGGSGLTILKPKVAMNQGLLMEYASYINECCSWRFCYGRMVTKERLEKLEIPKLVRDK